MEERTTTTYDIIQALAEKAKTLTEERDRARGLLSTAENKLIALDADCESMRRQRDAAEARKGENFRKQRDDLAAKLGVVERERNDANTRAHEVQERINELEERASRAELRAAELNELDAANERRRSRLLQAALDNPELQAMLRVAEKFESDGSDDYLDALRDAITAWHNVGCIGRQGV